MHSIVIMGVAGCGKSSLGAAVAQACGLPLIEGDDHHSASNRQKMQLGIALTDADRDGWLGTLSALLQHNTAGAVLTCSALKRTYRERLRAAAPGLRFVFLDIPHSEAQARVAGRPGHFFHSSLVDNQFAVLESPVGEDGVLHVDAMLPLDTLQRSVSAWLHIQQANP